MALRILDYGSQEGQELFNDDKLYANGERRWAARANWFIRFWGYVFQQISRATTVNPGSSRTILFVDSDNGTLTSRTGDDFKTYGTAEDTIATNKKYAWFIS